MIVITIADDILSEVLPSVIQQSMSYDRKKIYSVSAFHLVFDTHIVRILYILTLMMLSIASGHLYLDSILAVLVYCEVTYNRLLFHLQDTTKSKSDDHILIRSPST